MGINTISGIILEIDDTKNALIELLKLEEDIALIEAMNLVEEFYGYDLTRLKKLLPTSENRVANLSMVDIAKRLGLKVSEVDKRLIEKGLKVKCEDGKYCLTERGEKYGKIFHYEGDGFIEYFCKWNEDVLDIIR